MKLRCVALVRGKREPRVSDRSPIVLNTIYNERTNLLSLDVSSWSRWRRMRAVHFLSEVGSAPNISLFSLALEAHPLSAASRITCLFEHVQRF